MGAGGASVAVLRTAGSTVNLIDSTFDLGTPGEGGQGGEAPNDNIAPGGDGEPGASGQTAIVEIDD